MSVMWCTSTLEWTLILMLWEVLSADCVVVLVRINRSFSQNREAQDVALQ